MKKGFERWEQRRALPVFLGGLLLAVLVMGSIGQTLYQEQWVFQKLAGYQQWEPKFYGASGSSYYYETVGYGTLFLNTVAGNLDSFRMGLGLLLAVLVWLQFSFAEKGSRGVFTAGLPVTKKERLYLKWKTGVLVITIPYVLLFAFSLWERMEHLPWILEKHVSAAMYAAVREQESLFNLCLLFLLNWLLTLAFYQLMISLQIVLQRGLPALAAGVILPQVPAFLVMSLNYILLRAANRELPFYQELTAFFAGRFPLIGSSDQLLPFLNSLGIGRVALLRQGIDGGSLQLFYAVDLGTVPWKLFGAAAVLLLTGFFSWHYHEMQDAGVFDRSVAVPWIGGLFRMGIAVCAGLVMMELPVVSRYGIAAALFAGGIFALLIWLLLGRLFERRDGA